MRSSGKMNPDVVVSVRHYGTQRDGHVARSASSSSRDRVIALSLIAGMVVAAVCCVVFLSPGHSAALESDQDSIDYLLNKIDKLTASTSPTARRSAALAPHVVQEHVRLNVETPEQKFLDEVSLIRRASSFNFLMSDTCCTQLRSTGSPKLKRRTTRMSLCCRFPAPCSPTPPACAAVKPM